MSARTRAPSAKAREIASSLRDDSPTDTKKRSTSSKPSKAKSKSKSSPAPKKPSAPKVYSQYDEPSPAPTAPSTTVGSSGKKAYCVCLGEDDNTPMIQCEGCDNWYHFRCIDLQIEVAQRIKVYFCESCTIAGVGETQYLRKPRANSASGDDHQDEAYNSADDKLPSSADEVESDDEDAPISAAKKRRPAVQQRRPKKRVKAEGTSDEEDQEDGAYLGEGDPEVEDLPVKKRPANIERRGKLETMATKRKSSSSSGKLRVASDPQTLRTRQGCRSQLTKTLDAIYESSDASVIRLDVDDIEQELFDATAEADASGCLAPKTKYSNRFRTLFSNLRSNAYLRSRIAGNSPEDLITPNILVNMSPEDLLTPEQRALAQQVRDQAMKDSIKAAVEAPKSKITHKGEEVVDEYATTDDRVVAPHRRQSSIAQSPGGAYVEQSPPPAASPTEEGRMSPPERAFSPSASSSMPPPQRRPSGLTIKPEDVGGEAVSPTTGDDRAASAPVGGPPASPRTSFNLDSVWGSFQSPTTAEQSPPLASAKGEDDMDVDSDEGKGKEEEEYEPDFEATAGVKTNDADLDALLRGDESSAAPSNAPSGPSRPPPSGQLPIEQLFPVWDGICDGPNEPAFSGYAVQVAGRLLGTAKDMWTRILPSRFRIEGTLALPVGSDYLVQSTFSTSREIVVLALLPDTGGPSILYPEKMPADQAANGHASLCGSLLSRKKIAVVLPGDRQKKAVRDLYLVPLGRREPVPDFVELLDAHALGEGNSREKDLILVVAVLTKGALPIPTFEPAPAPVPPPQQQQQPINPLANVDPAAIQALLQQPNVLQGLVGGPPPSIPPAMPTSAYAQPPTGPPVGPGSNLLANLDPSVLNALLRPGQAPPQPQQQQQEAPRSGYAMNPERAAMMAAAGRGGGPMGGRGGPPPQQQRGGWGGRGGRY